MCAYVKWQQLKRELLLLMLLLNKLTAALNEKKQSIVIFCDLKKAFDTCDHDILLQKMFNIGIRNTELAWFSNYLTLIRMTKDEKVLAIFKGLLL